MLSREPTTCAIMTLDARPRQAGRFCFWRPIMKIIIRAGCQLLGALSAGVTWLVGSPWRSFLVLFLLSFVLRLNQLNQIPNSHLIPNADRELGAIAISLMKSGDFADTYVIPTGPTAHLPPVYPYIVSAIYRWYGLTPAAGYASMLLIALAASVLYALLPWIADQFGMSRQAGFLGGVAAALSKEEWYRHGEYLTGIVLALLLVAFLRRWTRRRVSWYGSLLLGLAIGAAFHLQPALLPVMLGCFAFELWWGRGRRNRAFLGVCALGTLLACVPWAWRNYTTFNAIFFIRSNLGLELRMGNHEGAAATFEEMDARPYTHYQHPKLLPSEAAKVRELGEAEYMRLAGQDALEWIRAHPGEFLSLTLQRFANLWGGPWRRPQAAGGVMLLTLLAACGLWLNLRTLTIPQRAVLIIPLATYPLIYYLVAYMPDYRAPIDWILFVLAGSLVWRGIGGFRAGHTGASPNEPHPTA